MTRLLTVLAFGLMLPARAFALPVTFQALLTGANESPPMTLRDTAHPSWSARSPTS